MQQDISNFIKGYIRVYEDFPKKGVSFQDLMPLFKSIEAREKLCTYFVNHYDGSAFDVIAGVDARGFVLATMMAECFKKPLVLIRKHGKLPGPVFHESYHLEYGFSSLEIQQDAFSPGENVFLVDDLLATGGTLSASIKLIEKAKAKVYRVMTLIELQELNGRARLGDYPVDCLFID